MSIFSKLFKEKIDKLINLEVKLGVEKKLVDKRIEVANLLRIETEKKDKVELELNKAVQDLQLKKDKVELELNKAVQDLQLKLSEVNLLADSYDVQIQGLNILKNKNETIQSEIADTLTQKKIELNQAQKDLENESLKYSRKIIEVKELTEKVDVQKLELNIQIQETQRIRKNAEEEQKKLWEKLDILRDSFTADQIWSKLWGLAYSKAIDATWPILEKEIPHLVELAEARAYLKARKDADEDYKIQLEGLIKIAGDQDISKIRILSLKKEIHEKMLIANRSKNNDFENKYLGQLELIELLIGGPK